MTASLEEELTTHMMKEEQILFPAIAEMSAGRTEPVALDDPIARMLREHEEAGAALARLGRSSRKPTAANLKAARMPVYELTEAADADLQAIAQYTISTWGSRAGAPLRSASRKPLAGYRAPESLNPGVPKA